jgi:predicted acyltransferase
MQLTTQTHCNMTNSTQLTAENERILSIDFFRGITMFLLIGEFSGLFESLTDPFFQGTIVSFLGKQLEHHSWNGLRFWDLIQPFFMFIVGVSMPFSFTRRWNKGDSWNETLHHTLKRSFWLLFFGWALYCIGPGKIGFRLTNVLAQLSVTYLIAFLLMRKTVKWQLLASFALILLSFLLYQLWPIEGFNQPYIADHNFGAWFDLNILGQLNGGHWVAFNAIPTSAHTIWGVVAGMILMNEWPPLKKIRTLVVAGILGVLIGFALDPWIPIIKRICTPTFVFASGGFALMALALSYWLIDVVKFTKGIWVFALVGMNPLFIYLFAHIGGNELIAKLYKPFVPLFFGWGGELAINIVVSSLVWFTLWYICYFLYRRKIFIRV